MPFQRALCERLLVVVRFAIHDTPGAKDSQVRFDLALGEAAQQAWKPIAAVWEPDQGVAKGEVSMRWLLKQTIASVRNTNKAKVIWDTTNTELSAVGGLLGDAATFARMLDMSSPSRAPTVRRSEFGKAPVLLEMDAAIGEPVRIGGVTCTIEQNALHGRHSWAVQVHVNAGRSAAVPAHWTARNAQGAAAIFGRRYHVEPGATTNLASYDTRNMPENMEHWPQDVEYWPEKIEVNISGMRIITIRNPFR